MIGISIANSLGLNRVSGINPDAAAFIAAANITDSTQISAINTLVNGLQSDGLWTKMKAIYPFVGGTATTHKYNLKDPRDLDAAFRLVFNGGWTHSSTGATPNGTNGYADTKLVPSVALAPNNIHLSYYSRTQSASIQNTTMGCDDSASERCRLIIRRTGDQGFNVIGNATKGLSTFTVSDSRGLFIANAPNSTTRDFYKNSSSLTPISQTTFGVNGTSTNNMYIGAFQNNIIAAEFDSKECAFSSIGDGLTSTEAANLYTRVQAFQTSLSRQV